MMTRIRHLLLKPVLASLAGGLGAMLRSRALLLRAARWDRENVRAQLQLLVQEGLDEHRIRRFTMVPAFLREVGFSHLELIERNFSSSRSQLLQDLFVLAALRGKRNGFFVEVGVGDGEYLSNTWLLEKAHGWKGILAEPNRAFAAAISQRRSAILETDAVWSDTGLVLDFVDVAATRELSTLKEFASADEYQRPGGSYSVRTVSLNELLQRHNAPDHIDYMSIDTEGSEWQILSEFDFERYRVSIFTIEHNFSSEKLARITALLEQNDYVRVHAGLSRFDAWFVARRCLNGQT